MVTVKLFAPFAGIVTDVELKLAVGLAVPMIVCGTVTHGIISRHLCLTLLAPSDLLQFANGGRSTVDNCAPGRRRQHERLQDGDQLGSIMLF